MKKPLLTGLLAVLLVGCITSRKTYTRVELYFGQSRPDGSLIAAADWQAFSDSVITPVLPEGLSVADVHGQWKEASGKVISEPSKVVLAFVPLTKERSQAIDCIRQKYCRYFRQESVMRVDSRVKAIRF